MKALAQDEIVALVGAGTMGQGIAQVAAAAGHKVLLFDQTNNVAKQALLKITENLHRLVTKGRISEEQAQALVSRITPVDSLKALAPAALVIEAIIEDLAMKQQLFSELEAICAMDTIFASNTSSISITAIGVKLQHPERLVGMHFFNPAPIMKLVEVISGLASNKQIAQKVLCYRCCLGQTGCVRPLNTWVYRQQNR